MEHGFRWFREFFRNSFSPLGFEQVSFGLPGEEDEAAFAKHAWVLTVNSLKYTSVVMFTLTFGTIFTDFLVFPAGSRELITLLTWRGVIILSCAFVYVALKFSRRCRNYPNVVGMTSFSLAVAASGWLVGSYGGLESPLTYGIYSTPLLTVLLIVPVLRRTLYSIWLVIAFAAGFILPFPEHLQHPLIWSPLVWLFGVIATNVAVGHLVYILLKANFMQRRSLDRVVAKQTSEIRELATRLVSMQERERTRIGRDIHDEFGQILTGLRMESERLKLMLDRPGVDVGRVRDGVGVVGDLLEALTGSVDQVLRDLRPPALEGGAAISEAIRLLATGVAMRHGIRVKLAMDASPDEFDQEQATAFYRIVQESLTNVIRHARATEVSVSLKPDGDALVLTVKDDGCGFDCNAVQTAGRFGISGIRERAHWLGWKSDVRSRPGHGTVVTVKMPWMAERRGKSE